MFLRFLKEAVARIPITIYSKILKKMQHNAEKLRKMAEIFYSLCLIAKAEDILLDLIMIKVLQVDYVT
ncbi:uncharacterized protein LOC108116939 [Drosophila eugracilis]|uniref:uncharacterized protein LOC108116939 n=1 Tax=Drosophila eugracilis TaxID=29029 RepID=UPI0007E899D5|nr:uncharacterized protein LOC108116939 [Drosophila eugracilis]